jgi:serine/threonine-protein kinase SRPK3
MASLYCVEDPHKYTIGGYHPIDIGDQLHHGRYRIIHRLGDGGSATVWLALNQHYDNAAHPDAPCWRYVAVKIATASSNNHEAAILRRLQAGHRFHDGADRKHPGSQFIIALLDEFQVTGPNGSHCCIVTELLGPTIRDVKNCISLPGWAALPVLIGRRFAVQAANAVAFLHSQGIVHAGRFYLAYVS